MFFKQYSVVYDACSICPLLVRSLKTTESVVHVIRSSKILAIDYGPTVCVYLAEAEEHVTTWGGRNKIGNLGLWIRSKNSM